MKKTTVKEAKAEMTDRLYAVLRRPVITEKAMKVSEQGQVTFTVPMGPARRTASPPTPSPLTFVTS